jgi:hypothetical protein
MRMFGEKGKFALVALAILAISLISGYYISRTYGFNPLLTISTIFTAGILLVGLFETVSTDEQPRPEIRTENSGDSPEEIAESSSNSDEDSSQRIGSSAGLRPEQKQIQNELLQVAYQEFEQDPFSFMLTYQAPHLVEEVADRTNSEQDDVSHVWQFCKDDGFFRKRGNAWRMTPKAVFRAEELGEDVHLDDNIQEDLLNSLLQEYRNDPHRSRVSQNTLLNSFSHDREVIMQNMWYLCEKNYVERESYVGGNAEYEITGLGRRVAE